MTFKMFKFLRFVVTMFNLLSHLGKQSIHQYKESLVRKMRVLLVSLIEKYQFVIASIIVMMLNFFITFIVMMFNYAGELANFSFRWEGNTGK